jgi:hypothetical protein
MSARSDAPKALALAVGVAVLALIATSHAASTDLPAQWKPPAGATVDLLQNPLPGTGMPQLRRTSWHVAADASGQQAGTFVLTQNAANPLADWVMAFRADAGGGGVLGFSKTKNGGLLAQAAASGQ